MNMNNSIPPALATYLQECIGSQSLTLLTSVLDTPANWLVIKLLTLTLNQSRVSAERNVPQTPNDRIIFVSIWRPFETWIEIAKKSGLNLIEKIAADQICYIDCLSSEMTTPHAHRNIVKLKELSLKYCTDAVYKAMEPASDQVEPCRNTVILDGIDFLLACNTEVSSIELQQTLTEIQHKANSVIVTCAADSPLLHNIEASATPLEREHSMFIRQAAYQARLVLQLRPLETGHSKDVSGTVRVSKGGAWETTVTSASRELEEGERLYQVKGDGTVKVWARGEA